MNNHWFRASALLAITGMLTIGLSATVSAATTNSVIDNGDGTATVTYTTTTGTWVYACAPTESVSACGFDTTPLYRWGGAVPLTGSVLEISAGMTTELNSGGATALPGGSYTIVLWPGGIRANRVGSVGVGINTLSPDAVSASTNAPEPILQQVPMPVNGSCSNVLDEHLNWGTDLRGGWTSTWAQWANNGSGGVVCSRTLSFQGAWQLS